MRLYRKAKKQTGIMLEEYVPGESLAREGVEECSSVQLKHWLTCRGAKSSGKKSALVYRSNACIFCFRFC